MEKRWTDAQNEAITLRGANIVVNAAAGSGKTAVLTARIIGLLVPEDGSEPVSADKLLVVTFTRLAASEMRERIENGLRKLRVEAEESSDLKKKRLVSKQIRMLAAAKIMTIDSFCQTVINEYFHLIGIDPAFSVIEQTDAIIIKEQIFAQLCADKYAKKDADFLLLVNGYCKNGSEAEIKKMVFELHSFSRTMPHPEEYIRKAAREYKCEGGFENSVFYEELIKESAKLLDKSVREYREALDLVPEGEDWEDIRNLLSIEKEQVEKLCEIDEKLMPDKAKTLIFNRFSGSKKIKSELYDRIHSLRESAKNAAKDIAGVFSGSENVEAFMKNILSPVASALCGLTLEFSAAYEEYKLKNGMLEFSDIEQLTHRLLEKNEDVRNEQKNRYCAVFIDEYQDTNSLQDEIFAMISRDTNMFIVGDIKQSIYRFRSSDPLVFLNKIKEYTSGKSSKNRQIYLSENFRSRQEVISAVNDLFEMTMSCDVGEVEYDQTQRLNCGNKTFIEGKGDYCAECVMIENEDNDEGDIGRIRTEAVYIAGRISDMIKNEFLVSSKQDGDTPGTRPVKCSDIAILMSSHKNAAPVFMEVLSEFGIGCVCENSGYFVKPEIKVMMSLLRIIENPQRDVAMCAVLRSCVGGFSDDEIARLRQAKKKSSFYDALIEAAQKENILIPEELRGRINEFLCEIEKWRDLSRFMSADMLVRRLYESTGLYAFFGAAADDEAQANLRLFFDRAKKYEQAGFKGLFAFLRHMEQMEESGKDLEGVNFAGSDDCVRLMTIHKSKGLEMPVVFLAGCGRNFYFGERSKMILHKDLGMSIDYVNYEQGVEIPSPIRKVFEKQLKNEMVSEEIRKLYVALTRAEEKIIATACVDTIPALEDIRAEKVKNTAQDAKRFIDWILPAAQISDNWDVKTISYAELQTAYVPEIKPKSEEAFICPDISAITGFVYPYAGKIMKSKSAVSEFKGMSEEYVTQPKPRFLAGTEMGGAAFGTWVHKVMETLPAEHGNNIDYVKTHIMMLSDDEESGNEAAKQLYAEKIVRFYSSELGKRIVAAGNRVNRESEFEIGIDADKLYNNEEFKGETALLQGVIDCWFEEDGELVLVDYKTDRVDEIEQIHEKYDIQLDLYKEALEKITKKRVKEKFIYLFSRDIVVQC